MTSKPAAAQGIMKVVLIYLENSRRAIEMHEDLMDWFDLLTLYGFTLEKEQGVPLRIDCRSEVRMLFKNILRTLGIEDSFDERSGTFNPPTHAFSESAFLEAYYRNRNGYLDPHIARLVMIVNELGGETHGSCEGHGLRSRDGTMIGAGEGKPGRRRFRGAYLDCDECTRIALTMINPDLEFDFRNSQYFRINARLTPEEQERDLWENLKRTAEIMAKDREKAQELIAAIRKVVELRDELLSVQDEQGEN